MAGWGRGLAGGCKETTRRCGRIAATGDGVAPRTTVTKAALGGVGGTPLRSVARVEVWNGTVGDPRLEGMRSWQEPASNMEGQSQNHEDAVI